MYNLKLKQNGNICYNYDYICKKNHTMHQILVNTLLFKGLAPNEIDDLLVSITYKNKKFTKNETIAFSGSELNGINILLRGSVRGEMVDYSGKVIKIEDIESPRTLAPAFLFGENNNYPVDIVANNNVELLYFHKNVFLKILQLNQTVLMNYLNIISTKSQFLSTKLKFLSFQTIKGKFAHYLINLAKQDNNILILPLSQTKLADLFGVSRPALGRVIRELHNDKIIYAEGKSIKILNRNVLINLIK